MTNKLMIKTALFSVMCVVYLFSLAHVSASPIINNISGSISDTINETIGNTTAENKPLNITVNKANSKTINDITSLEKLEQIQNQWLAALDSNSNQRQRFYEIQGVAKRMFRLSIKHPHNASMQAWSGIMLSSFAGASIKGRGDQIAISAKRMLEKAQLQKPDVLDSSFLSNGMSARTALQHALAYNVSGLDIYKYYGVFVGKDTTKMLVMNRPAKTAHSPHNVTHGIN